MKFEAKSLLDKFLIPFVMEATGVIIMLGFVSAGIVLIPFEAEWSMHGVVLLLLTGAMISSMIKDVAENMLFESYNMSRLTFGWIINTIVLDIMLVYVAKSLGVASNLSELVLCFSFVYTLVYIGIKYCIIVGRGTKRIDIN